MRKLLIALVVLFSALASAQTAKTPPLWCETGGMNVIVQGLPSVGFVQTSMPNCLVTVYNTGTQTLATITGTSGNPFTANADGSFGFTASTALNYDIVMQGTTYCVPLINGCPSNGQQTTVVTLVNVSVQGGGGSGGGTITGATANGGLVVSGSTLGMRVDCSNGNSLVWNSTAWVCGSGGTGSSTSGQLLYNNAGSIAGVCSYDGVSTLTCVNLTATNVTVNGTLNVAGAYVVLASAIPVSPLGCPANGFLRFGVNNDGYIAECLGGTMSQAADLIYQTNASASDAGEDFVGASGGANPGATSVTRQVDAYTYCGNTDLGASIAACKTLHFNDGVQINAESFNVQGTAIKWGTSDYVSGYTGPPVLLPQGVINVQKPNTVFMQARTDMQGMGLDSTIFQVCISGNLNCNGVFFPTSASIPTYCVVGWTDDGVTCNFNNGGIQDSILSSFSIDGQSNSGLICLANFVGQEDTGPRFYSVHGCANHSVSVGFGGAFVQVSIGAPVQHASTTTSTPCTTCAVTLGSATVAGDTIPTCAMWGTSGGIPTLSSVSGNVLGGNATAVGTLGTDGNFAMQCNYASNINAAPGGTAFNYNFSGNTNTSFTAMAAEWSNIIGLGTLDQVSSPTVVTTGNPACPTITTTKNGELVVCAIIAESAGAAYAVGTTSGCAAAACVLTVGTALQGMEYVLQGSAGAITLNWTSATTRRAIVVTMSFVPGTNNGPGTQNSLAGPGNIYVARNETSTADSVLMELSTGVVGEAGPAYIGPHTTITVNSGFLGTAPTNLVDILDGTGVVIETMHLESANSASTACGLRVGAGAGVKGLYVNNLNSGQMNTSGALLCISNVGNSAALKFTNTNAVGANYPTNLIADLLSGCTDPITNESIVSNYELGSQGSVVGGYFRLSSSNYPGCQSQFGSLLYQIDDPTLCHVYSSGGGGAQNCTNSSLVNPTPGQELIFTAFPPNTTSITLTDNGIGPHTAGFIQIVTGSVVNALLGTTCTPKSTFAPTYDPYMTGSVPYVPGVTLGTMTFTMGSAYVSGPVCVEIRLTGYDQ